MTHSTDDELLDAIFELALISARNDAFDTAVKICNAAHRRGLNASAAGLAIRETQNNVNERLTTITQALTQPANVN